VPAEEAAPNVQGLGIVVAAISKHYYTVLADAVPAGQAVLRSPAQTAQAGAAALDAVLPVLEARKVVFVDIRYCLPVNKLLKVADKVVYKQVSNATL
jgi:hypothetical protein